jgi:hypothetical protein
MPRDRFCPADSTAPVVERTHRQRLIDAVARMALRYPNEVRPSPTGFVTVCPSCGTGGFSIILVN